MSDDNTTDDGFRGCRMSNSPNKGPLELLKALYKRIKKYRHKDN